MPQERNPFPPEGSIDSSRPSLWLSLLLFFAGCLSPVFAGHLAGVARLWSLSLLVVRIFTVARLLSQWIYAVYVVIRLRSNRAACMLTGARSGFFDGCSVALDTVELRSLCRLHVWHDVTKQLKLHPDLVAIANVLFINDYQCNIVSVCHTSPWFLSCPMTTFLCWKRHV